MNALHLDLAQHALVAQIACSSLPGLARHTELEDGIGPVPKILSYACPCPCPYAISLSENMIENRVRARARVRVREDSAFEYRDRP